MLKLVASPLTAGDCIADALRSGTTGPPQWAPDSFFPVLLSVGLRCTPQTLPADRLKVSTHHQATATRADVTFLRAV